MDVEVIGETTDDAPEVVSAKSAYMFFSKLNFKRVKDENPNLIFAAVASKISEIWRGMTDKEKEKYVEMGREDRKRFERETKARDEFFVKLQEEKRKGREVKVLNENRRSSTLQSSATSSQKWENNEERRKARDERLAKGRERAEARMSNVRENEKSFKRKMVAQTKKRLKYIMKQANVLSHFLPGGNSKEEEEEEEEDEGGKLTQESDVPLSPIKRRNSMSDPSSPKGDTEDEKGDNEEDEEDEDDDIVRFTENPMGIVNGTMRLYQLEGLNWMVKLYHSGVNGIVGDQMGLGKTLQSISVLSYLAHYLHISGPFLVVVPKSTLQNWANEFEFWCPSLSVFIFHGDKEERKIKVEETLKPLARNEDREWDVLITTYEMVTIELPALRRVVWEYLVLDEAHKIKNTESQAFNSLTSLKVHSKLLLTRTPLQNNLQELWSLLHFILPDLFADVERFNEFFDLEIDDTTAKRSMIETLHKILKPFMIRRLKHEVERDLPPKKEILLSVEMPKIQRELYTKLLRKELFLLEGKSKQKAALNNLLMQLRKCCNHPYLFPGVEDETLPPYGEHVVNSCGKLRLLSALLKKLMTTTSPDAPTSSSSSSDIPIERPNKILIFCQMTRMMDILEDVMAILGYRYFRIDGQTDYEDRQRMIDSFNGKRLTKGKVKKDKEEEEEEEEEEESDDELKMIMEMEEEEEEVQIIDEPEDEVKIFMLSTRAGGLGINLQAANVVILFDSDWNPQMDLQAMDRAHRIGQTRNVAVYRFLTEGTVEEKIVERAKRKLKLDAMIIRSGKTSSKNSVSSGEILDAIRFNAEKILSKNENDELEWKDEDIDKIIERGLQKTVELNEKISEFKDEELYDFSIEDSNLRQFEGKDYSKFIKDNIVKMMDEGPRQRRVKSQTYNLGEMFKKYTVQDDDEIDVDKPTKKSFEDLTIWEKRRRVLPKNVVGNFKTKPRPFQLFEFDIIEPILGKFLNNLPVYSSIFFYLEQQLYEFQSTGEITQETQERVDEAFSHGFGNWTRNDLKDFETYISEYGEGDFDQFASKLRKNEQEGLILK